jgi:hypothetical protein
MITATKRPARRRGRWTYDATDNHYGEAGWHLDGTPIVIDFMPGDHQCCNGGRGCCHGSYLLYGWPGREHEAIATHVDFAMECVEGWWDKLGTEGQGALVARLADYRARVAAWSAS